jgi:hypothetical protein
MRVGEAASLRRQRHEQKKARERVSGNHQFRDDFEVVVRLLLGPKARTGRKRFQVQGSTAVPAYFVTNVAAGVIWPALFNEDGLDARFEKFIVKRRA